MGNRLLIYYCISTVLSSISIIAMEIPLPVQQPEMKNTQIFFELVNDQWTEKVPLNRAKELFPQFIFDETKKEHRIVQCIMRCQVSTADTSDYQCSAGDQSIVWTPYTWWLNVDNEDTTGIAKAEFIRPLPNEVKFLYPRSEKVRICQLIADKIEQDYEALLSLKEQIYRVKEDRYKNDINTKDVRINEDNEEIEKGK